jgi:hypothetical protein
MTQPDVEVIEKYVETGRYPLTEPGSGAWWTSTTRIGDELALDGCSVLANFIRTAHVGSLQREGQAAAQHAFDKVETVNVYNIDLATPLPEGHPGRHTMKRGNAFVARDQIDPHAIIAQLYQNRLFQRFVAACFGLSKLHELADPLSALVVNVIRPGREHPWHFDTNEFTVSLLTQQADAGGAFEYCPHIRSAETENLDGVGAVLEGRGEGLIHRITLRPGDLQLFKGRYALHRVSRVEGGTARHTTIFAYSERPGVVGSVSRTRQLFGRVLPEHEATERRVRVDGLLD